MEKGSWVAKAPLGQHARDKNRARFGFNRGEKPVSDNTDFILQLVDWAGDLLGSATGVSMAVVRQDVAGLYEGAAVGTGVAHMLKSAAQLFLTRSMAKREQERVGLVYGLAALAIKERLEKGEQLRTDDFLERNLTDRSESDEIAEAVLIAAQREHEERKLPYIAKLLAFVAFESEIDQGMANYLVKLASALTYRQYCLLEIVNNCERYKLRPPGLLNLSQRENASQVFAVLAECFELYRLGLVKFTAQFGLITKVEDMGLQAMALDVPMGSYLHLGMQLHEIAAEDVAKVAKLISAT